MSYFSYSALDIKGAFVRGRFHDRSMRRASEQLQRKGLSVINIHRDKRRLLGSLNPNISRITRRDKIVFTRSLHTLLEAGIALDQALHIIIEQTVNETFKKVVDNLYASVQKGETLHKALGNNRKYFSPFFISLIRVGEETGNLDGSLLHLLEQQENDDELITKVRGSLIYPAVIITAALIIATLMMIFVIPQITSILTEYDIELPLTTRILIYVSDFMATYGLLVLPTAFIAGFVGFRAMVSTPVGKRRWDSLKLRLPLVKKIVIDFNLAKFSRAMHALLMSGMSMDDALQLAAGVTGNVRYQEAILHGAKFIRKGIALTDVLVGYPVLFPALTCRMIEVGEKTGKLDHMLDRLARHYEKSVTNTLQNLSTIIEPILLLIIGVFVGLLGIAILTPIWNFADSI